MKIAMVSVNADPLEGTGSRNAYVAALCSELCRHGNEVVVYTRQNGPRQRRTVRAEGGYRVVRVLAGPAGHLPNDEDVLGHISEFARFLVGEWGREIPDVVHAHRWLSGLASALAVRRLGLSMVQTFHGLDAVERRHQGRAGATTPERLRLERVIGKSVSRIVACSTDELFELARLGLPRARMSVVPFGVDVDRFTTHGPAESTGELRRIVGVGKLVPRNGFATTISALAAVPGAELVIAGGPEQERLADDPEARRLRETARRAGVADRVRLLGRVSHDHMPALLRSAGLVACTPWYELSGVAALEAMACGVPVVATAVGALNDIVVDGVTGELVPPERSGALAATLRRLVDDPALSEAYGTAATDRARSRYSWDRIATDMVRVYEKAAPGPGRELISQSGDDRSG
ncbi:glycosyltransferase [Amycolatopsis pigmentata]|uniref:Glycosyltransferase n=1 Tax=Amycolatopsis pigmentata TaxID=450801 RepID=A0ABW5G688_9PSEU